MSGRLLPAGAALLALAMTPAYADTLSCGRLLDGAVDAPIPPSLVMGTTVVSFPGSEASLRLLSSHAASVAIDPMIGTFVGLGADVATCRASGCESFVYLTSNGVGAVSRLPMHVDGTTVLHVWDLRSAGSDTFLAIGYPFLRRGIDPSHVILADIYEAYRTEITWAGADFGIDDVDAWVGEELGGLSIPLYWMYQRPGYAFACEGS